jgi:hypothetical protein
MSPDKQTLPLAYNDNGKKKWQELSQRAYFFQYIVHDQYLEKCGFYKSGLGFGYVYVKSDINENRKKQ